MAAGPRDLGRPLPFAHYDTRNYPTLGVVEAYDTWSRFYEDIPDRFDVDPLEASPLLKGRVPGSEIVDLACGTGRIGRWMLGRGARSVVGVDLSPQMLAHAEKSDTYRQLVRADITATTLDARAFDGAVCSMALCHVASLAAFFSEARRLLRPGGWLSIVDFHPFFMFRGIPSHYDHPDTGEPVAIENHVHALSQFFIEAKAAGFDVCEMRERFVDDDWVEAMPNYRRHLGQPVTHFWAFTLR